MIFPLAASALIIVLNGTVVRSYTQPFLQDGHVMAPLAPFVTRVAASVGYSGGELIVRRADRFAEVEVAGQPQPADFISTFVPIASVLRTLGASVSYDAKLRVLIVKVPPLPLATPTPFNPAVPLVGPRVVFTPTPAQTPKPVVTGEPAPRRTPLPVSTSVPQQPQDLCCRTHGPSHRVVRARRR